MVRVLDTQAMARSVRIPSRGYQISLATLISYYNFAYRDSHTASNDAAYTVITTIFMAVYGKATNVPKYTKSVQKVVDDLEAHSVDETENQWEIIVFCTRCHRTNHFRAQWCARICCQKCRTAKRTKASYSHLNQDRRFKN
jgi:hypothetical protein